MSLSPADLLLSIRFGTGRDQYTHGSRRECYLQIIFPRFKRTEVGSSSRISVISQLPSYIRTGSQPLENVASRLDGSRDVVTKIRGSTTPDSCAYSSSSPSSSSAVRSARDSSYLKSALTLSSFCTSFESGFPVDRLARSAARFDANSASRSVRALRYK
jgi:hypothetical protein